VEEAYAVRSNNSTVQSSTVRCSKVQYYTVLRKLKEGMELKRR